MPKSTKHDDDVKACKRWLRGSEIYQAHRIPIDPYRIGRGNPGLHLGMKKDGDVVHVNFLGNDFTSPRSTCTVEDSTSFKPCIDARGLPVRGNTDVDAAINFMSMHGIKDTGKKFSSSVDRWRKYPQ